MGQVVGKLLGQSAGSGMGPKIEGFSLGRFMPKPKLNETIQSEAIEVVGPVLDPVAGLVPAKRFHCPSVAHGSSLRSEMISAADSGVVLGMSTSGGRSSCLHLDLATVFVKPSTHFRFVFPLLLTLEKLSSMSLDAPLALVSSTVGFGFSGSPTPLSSSSGSAGLTPQLKPEGSSQPIFAPPPSSEVAELGEKYYWKAREGRSVQLDEDLLAESLAAMRTPVSFTAKEAAPVPLVKLFVGMSDLVKKGFLRRGFLNLSPTVRVSTPLSSLVEFVVSSSTWEVKDDGVIGLPFPLSGCVTPFFENDNDFRMNGLSNLRSGQ
jgi:hypothetical protein